MPTLKKGRLATYDVIHRGHVIDPKNGIDALANIAIKDGKIAAVGAEQARRSDQDSGRDGTRVRRASSTSTCTTSAGGWLHPTSSVCPTA